MSEEAPLEWWTSPIDHHGHADGPRPDECAVCALQLDRDRLRVEGDALHEWGHQLEAIGKALAAELEKLRDDVTALRMLLTEATAERDQLRARIDAYEGRLEAWEEMDRLISQSSLGTPEAVALRERTPPEIGRAIVRASEYLGRAEEAEAERDRLRDDYQGVAELLVERDRLRKVVEHAIDTLTESAPSAPGVLATVALMRLALDPTELDVSADIGGEEG
jgi:chromosome segregation ATPase